MSCEGEENRLAVSPKHIRAATRRAAWNEKKRRKKCTSSSRASDIVPEWWKHEDGGDGPGLETYESKQRLSDAQPGTLSDGRL